MKDSSEYLSFSSYNNGKVVGKHTAGSYGNGYKSGMFVKDVIVPETYQNVKVIEIEYYSFRSTSIESIFIPRYVKEILYAAFYECKSLMHITFDAKSELSKIGTNAFYCTKLSSFNFPSSFSSIEENIHYCQPFHTMYTLTCVLRR